MRSRIKSPQPQTDKGVRVPQAVHRRDADSSAAQPGKVLYYPPLAANVYGSRQDIVVPAPMLAAVYERNIPDSGSPFELGSPVWSLNGDKLGTIEKILVSQGAEWMPDQQIDMATHLLVASGLFTKTRRLIPITWVTSFSDAGLTLSIRRKLFEKLPEYQPQAEQM